MRNGGLAIGVAIFSAAFVVGLAGSSRASAVPNIIEGPNAQQTFEIIRSVDRYQNKKLTKIIEGVTFSEGEYGSQPKRRLAKISDIPASINSVCRLDSVRGRGDVVQANWECSCCDIALNREFVFQERRLVGINNIFYVLG